MSLSRTASLCNVAGKHKLSSRVCRQLTVTVPHQEISHQDISAASLQAFPQFLTQSSCIMLKSTVLPFPALMRVLIILQVLKGMTYHWHAAIGVITASTAAAGGLARRLMPAGAHDYQTKE